MSCEEEKEKYNQKVERKVKSHSLEASVVPISVPIPVRRLTRCACLHAAFAQTPSSQADKDINMERKKK
jgi:hypothetical protein